MPAFNPKSSRRFKENDFRKIFFKNINFQIKMYQALVLTKLVSKIKNLKDSIY